MSAARAEWETADGVALGEPINSGMIDYADTIKE
jgi:hypothetical protein